MTADSNSRTPGTAQEKEPQLNLGFPLLLQKMEASVVGEPGTKEKKYAYEVTFVAVLPETTVKFLVNYLKEHRVHVRCIMPNDLEGE